MGGFPGRRRFAQRGVTLGVALLDNALVSNIRYSRKTKSICGEFSEAAISVAETAAIDFGGASIQVS